MLIALATGWKWIKSGIIEPLTDLYFYYAMMKLVKVDSVTHRGASRGSVWLSWQTPLHSRYSALKPIKYQTLSLQVSNAGGLEQATAYISLLTLHSNITKQQRCYLVETAPAQWHETSHVFNIRNWYCVERTCSWISSSDSASSNSVGISYTAMHLQELFSNISLHGARTVSNHDRFSLQFQANFVCCLHLLGYDKIK